MESKIILEKINQAIASLLNAQRDTLFRGLNERIISGHFADHLRPLFEGYDVDPEYNGDIDKPNDRKALQIAERRMIEIGYEPNNQNTYRLSPDIIIHRQGTNENNLVVIEVKKDLSPKKDKEYDLIKLEHLTINYSGNHYNYKLGVAVIFGTANNTGAVIKQFYQEGIPKTEETIA